MEGVLYVHASSFKQNNIFHFYSFSYECSMTVSCDYVNMMCSMMCCVCSLYVNLNICFYVVYGGVCFKVYFFVILIWKVHMCGNGLYCYRIQLAQDDDDHDGDGSDDDDDEYCTDMKPMIRNKRQDYIRLRLTMIRKLCTEAAG